MFWPSIHIHVHLCNFLVMWSLLSAALLCVYAFHEAGGSAKLTSTVRGNRPRSYAFDDEDDESVIMKQINMFAGSRIHSTHPPRIYFPPPPPPNFHERRKETNEAK
jgi:hypothetical protein